MTRWVLVSLWLLPSLALAMTVAMTTAMAEAKADRVVAGVVVGQHAEWVGRRIITFVMLQPDDAVSDQVRIAVPGGEVNGIGQRVDGSPVFAVGRRYRVALGAANGPSPRSQCATQPCVSRGVVGFAVGVTALPMLSDHSAPDALSP